VIRKSVVLGLLVASLSFEQTPARQIALAKTDGGSVVTNLSMGIAVNQNSTLTRRWFTLNDSSCPVSLEGTGVKSVYKPERYSGSYSFVPAGMARTQKAIHAVNIVFAVFDVWGDRMRNLSLMQVMDIPEGGTVPFEGSWYASENDVSEFYTSAAFVDRVMLSDGSIWRADRKAIAAKLAEVQIRVSEAGLEREPPKEPSK
jgi:hypothetical protein